MRHLSIRIPILLTIMFSFHGFAADLTSADEKLAATLVAALSSDDFDLRAQAETKLKLLVLQEPQKAAAWDRWLEMETKKTKDKEVLTRLPSHVAFRFKLCGKYRALNGSPGEIQFTIEFSKDGTYQILSGKNQQRRGRGTYQITAKAELVLQGTITPFSNTGDEEWSCKATLKDDHLVTFMAGDTGSECRWKRESADGGQKESARTDARK